MIKQKFVRICPKCESRHTIPVVGVGVKNAQGRAYICQHCGFRGSDFLFPEMEEKEAMKLPEKEAKIFPPFYPENSPRQASKRWKIFIISFLVVSFALLTLLIIKGFLKMF